MEINTYSVGKRVISPFVSPLEFNDIHGPINYWPRMRFLYKPMYEEVLENAAPLIQGDICIARSQSTRDAYVEYVTRLSMMGRKPVDDIRDNAAGSLYFLTKNKFPYELADAEHWLLFLMHPESTLDGAQEFLLRQCADQQIALNNVFAYQNPYGLRSVPQIPHFQLIIRR